MTDDFLNYIATSTADLPEPEMEQKMHQPDCGGAIDNPLWGNSNNNSDGGPNDEVFKNMNLNISQQPNSFGVDAYLMQVKDIVHNFALKQGYQEVTPELFDLADELSEVLHNAWKDCRDESPRLRPESFEE